MIIFFIYDRFCLACIHFRTGAMYSNANIQFYQIFFFFLYRFLVACTTCINKQDSFLWNKKNCFRVLTIFKFFLETSLFIVLFIVAHLIWEENVHIFSLCINERVSFSKYVHAKPLLSHAYFQNLFLDYLRDITCNYNYWSIWENQNVLGIQVLFFMGIRITYIQETGSIL